MKLRKIVTSVFVALPILFGCFLGVGTLGNVPHTFVGDVEFKSLEEVQAFQTEVVSAVEAVGGHVKSFDLQVMSPPKVHYILDIPDLTFQYGAPVVGVVPIVVLQVVMVLVFLSVIVVSYRLIWNESSLQEVQE